MDTKCELANKACVPCHGGIPPMKGQQLTTMLKELGQGWRIIEEHHLEKEYSFKDFAEALLFTNRVGEIAEKEGHHPDIQLSWGKVKILLWTHKIDGLSESDFILAAKLDRIPRL